MLENIDYNPDVLTCLANLSNDEVFTPPELVNDILDLLPKELFENKETTFLDPVTKSGVFLREIAKRLMDGLEDEIPDQQARINHIFKNQLYGIAITELTSLLARRSVYCSKEANGQYSICEDFDNEQGNILFERIEHTWKSDKCQYCGASKKNYARGDELETHAYQFIHTDNPKELFDMKFDVIVGNPPYQLSDGGDANDDARIRGGAIPIYQKFVEQAKKLNPRFLTMITPSRWFSGGRSLDEFRDNMINDKRVRNLIDYPVSSECFPGVEIKGGVSYFLWDRDNLGDCNVKTLRGKNISEMNRLLKEDDSEIFIRYNEAISILRKVRSLQENSFDQYVSAQKPFGMRTFERGSGSKSNNSISLYTNKGIRYIDESSILKNHEWINKYKVYITMAYGAGEDFPHQIINKPKFGEKNTCCTETYLVIGPFESSVTTKKVITYMQTKLFRFLVLLKKNTQHAARGVYQFVPMQDFSENWIDEKLYKKYGLDEKEIEFIESMIRPMELDNE